MDIEQLKYLLHLQKFGSFAKTADQFFTSHQVIRNAIINLENELNVKLVTSTNRGTILTAAGEDTAAYAQKVCLAFEQLTQSLKTYPPLAATPEVSTLKLYLVPGMATDYYFDLFDQFMAQNPALKLVTTISAFPQMFDGIDSFDNTLFLTILLPEKEIEDKLKNNVAKFPLKVVHLAKKQSFICVNKNSKYAKLKRCAFTDITDIPIYIFMNSNPYCTTGHDEALANLRYFGDFNAIKRILQKNQGAVLLKDYEFKYYFGKEKSGYVQIPLTNDTTALFIALVPPTLTPPMQNFLTFLREHL